jgi:hypothetical protein
MLVPATALEVNGAETSASPTAIPARRYARNAERGDLGAVSRRNDASLSKQHRVPFESPPGRFFEVSGNNPCRHFVRHRPDSNGRAIALKYSLHMAQVIDVQGIIRRQKPTYVGHPGSGCPIPRHAMHSFCSKLQRHLRKAMCSRETVDEG